MRALCVLPISFAAIVAQSVYAQERPEILYAAQADLDPVLAYQLPDDTRPDATGLSFGNYIVRPTLALSQRLDSHARAGGDGKGTGAVLIEPSFDMLSKAANYRLKVYARGSVVRDEKNGRDNVETFNGGFNYYHAPRADLTIAARAQIGRFAEDRTEIFTALSNASPIIFDQYQANAALSYRPGRFVFTPGFALERRDYHDNRQIDDPQKILAQQQRSNVYYGPTFEGGYTLSPATLFYIGGYYRRRERIVSVDPSQDANEFSAYAGVRIEPTPLTRLKVAAGWQKRQYSGILASPKGLYYNAALEWSVTPLVLLNLKASRELLDISAIQNGTTQNDSSISERLSGDITYAMRRNLRLRAYGAYEGLKLDQPSQHLRRAAAGVNADYSATDHLNWLLGLDWQQKDISAILSPYHFNRLRISTSVKISL